jgi:hypothetical protein
MSGTVTLNPDSSVTFDVTLAGGAVTSLQFTLTEAQMSATEPFDLQITADGDTYTLTVTPEAGA